MEAVTPQLLLLAEMPARGGERLRAFAAASLRLGAVDASSLAKTVEVVNHERARRVQPAAEVLSQSPVAGCAHHSGSGSV
jgi:hypothetical protein